MIDYQELLFQFQRGIDRRQAAEEALRAAAAGPDPQEQTFRDTLSLQLQGRNEHLQGIESEFQSVLQAVEQESNALIAEEDRRHYDTLRGIEAEAAKGSADIEQARDNSEWVVSSVLDERAEDGPLKEFDRFKAVLQKSKEEQGTELAGLETMVQQAFDSRGAARPLPREPVDPPHDRESAQLRFATATTETRKQLDRLAKLWMPRLVRGAMSLVLFAILTALIAAPFYFFVDPTLLGFEGGRQQGMWIGISLGAGAVAGLILTAIFYSLAMSQQSEVLGLIQDLSAEAEWAHQFWLRYAKEQLERQQKETELHRRQIAQERQEALRRYESAHRSQVELIERTRQRKLNLERKRHDQEWSRLTQERDAQLSMIHEEHARQVQAATAYWEQAIGTADQALQHYVSNRQRTQRELWSTLKAEWDEVWQNFDSTSRKLLQEGETKFPDWKLLSQGNWSPSARIPDAVRLGDYVLDLNVWSGAISEDVRLAPRQTAYRLPALLKFPTATSLLFRCPSLAAREQAVLALQSVVLRLLTLIPPGKLRLTIIDPVGLGESFGGFMHLADYDEMLVTSRIWTEPNQIEARLADLTEHMENVLQKYLRNEFQTIEEYNASAGEVAEPYHILIISDFPSKFSEIAARRLISIINSGPRCGVYTLMSLDTTKQLPNGFRLADVEPRMTSLEWRGSELSTAYQKSVDPLEWTDGKGDFDDSLDSLTTAAAQRKTGPLGDGSRLSFYLREAALAAWPIDLDRPPPSDQFTAIVKMVGEASKDARRVEVSFERIAPDPRSIWAGDSRKEIEIPLGRAGATKLQRMRLGKGTSQHMLVAGKTGSGKSTFLHILITNLALHYSPDEVNFYLIDFKKGVEFKSYASHQLPHARVIAVESDREFGVSTLQKLDEVLQERGELFRRHGVQDIAGYRNATNKPLPRILLIVDEFQEFFVEDDKLGQSAALLLDRLVRQGRAFGMHVVLGSQTLGGAYSLARSTLGQVAVRVALQCSEADAHLILSEENTAARLLTRPGEAIYNDANGVMEGNHPFQIAWLSDDQRDAALKLIRERTMRRGVEAPSPVVFEGNIPSDLTRNGLVSTVIDTFSTRPEPAAAPTIWLGDAVEIAPPTSMTFHRHSGSHLLIVGQDSEAALGLMTASAIALSAAGTNRPEQPTIQILDGSHPGSLEYESWKKGAQALTGNTRLSHVNDVVGVLQSLTTEMKRREAEADTTAPPLFLLVFNLARFRDLRKAEDDYSFSSFGSQPSEKPVEPGKLFADLLTQGPAMGIHVIIWCDSMNNLERWLSRQSQKELETRVAFQMNASDSSNFIDSPAASRLGTHRALLYREETGTAEKFRPYGMPPAAWFDSLRERLRHGPAAEFATDLEEFSIL
ncbi:FtsK/SpoIIIE domain-containing protein [Planctomicrobium sp. SH664]|uniref:FtsK/SpoIIIE domain-containing protein n=1 Tax=Planctomicrobium sp. SH664 TaxID=3448125 RepID=UPI003F5C92F1